MQNQSSSHSKNKKTQWHTFYQQSHSRYISFWLQFLQEHAAEYHIIETDEVNIRSAWLAATKQERETDLLLALEPLYQFYRTKGRLNEGQGVIATTVSFLNLSKEDISKQPLVRQKLYGRLLARQAWFCWNLARYNLAKSLVERSWTLSQKNDDKENLAFLYLIRASTIYYQDGNKQQQKNFNESSYELYSEIGDMRGMVRSLQNLAINYNEAGDYETAKELLQEAITICQQQGDGYLDTLVRCLINLGVSLEGLEQYTEANTAYEACYEVCEQLQNQLGMSYSLANQSQIALRLNHFAKAKASIQKQILISQKISDHFLFATGKADLGNAYYMLKEFPLSLESLREGLNVAIMIGSKPAMIHVISQFSHLLYHLGEDILSLTLWTIIQPYLNPHHHLGNPENLHEILVSKLAPKTVMAIQSEWEGKELDDAVRLIQNYMNNYTLKNE